MAEFSCKTCIYYFTVKNRLNLAVCTNKNENTGELVALDTDKPCRNYHETFGCRIDKSQPKENIRFIPLTRGKFATVDSDNFEHLMMMPWHALKSKNTFYAACRLKNKYIFMHRYITNPPDDMVVDHIDGNGLNNTRDNLRICTLVQNFYNSRPVGGTSMYKGVHWRKHRRKWTARIEHSGTRFNLGCFDSEKEAAKAYDRKAKELRGEYAWLNFPNESRTQDT